jgi:hypothetical protein
MRQLINQNATIISSKTPHETCNAKTLGRLFLLLTMNPKKMKKRPKRAQRLIVNRPIQI